MLRRFRSFFWLGALIILTVGVVWFDGVRIAQKQQALAQGVVTIGPSGAGAPIGNFSLSTTVTTIATIPAGGRKFLAGVHFVNPNTIACYIQFFDAASATLGTTTNKFHIYIPPANGQFLGTYDYGYGVDEMPAFLTAMIAYATTTAGGNTTCGTAIDAVISWR